MVRNVSDVVPKILTGRLRSVGAFESSMKHKCTSSGICHNALHQFLDT